MQNPTVGANQSPVATNAWLSGLVFVPFFLSIWPFARSLMIFLNRPSVEFAAIIIPVAMILVVIWFAVDKYRYSDLSYEISGILPIGRYTPFIWAIISIGFSIASFSVEYLGYAAMGSALAAIGSEFFVNQGRFRFVLWFLCFVSPVILIQPDWQNVQRYANEITAWATSGVLDMSAIPHLRTDDGIETGAISLKMQSLYSNWNGIETYLAICVAACLLFKRSLFSLLLSLTIAFYWCIGIRSCQAAIDVGAAEGLTTIFGMGTTAAGWALVVIGILGVLLLEQFVAALCYPIFFNTLDTPLPIFTQALNRILSFPFPIRQNLQSPAKSSTSRSREEYEEISVSALSLGGTSASENQMEVVRFEEVLQRNQRNLDNDREQA